MTIDFDTLAKEQFANVVIIIIESELAIIHRFIVLVECFNELISFLCSLRTGKLVDASINVWAKDHTVPLPKHIQVILTDPIVHLIHVEVESSAINLVINFVIQFKAEAIGDELAELVLVDQGIAKHSVVAHIIIGDSMLFQ